ncbi:hypothetical protein LINGRAHAP2_LOCUS22741 [Linum grandiflorum]
MMMVLMAWEIWSVGLFVWMLVPKILSEGSLLALQSRLIYQLQLRRVFLWMVFGRWSNMKIFRPLTVSVGDVVMKLRFVIGDRVISLRRRWFLVKFNQFPLALPLLMFRRNPMVHGKR